jgi:hypothetical protein
MGAVQSVKLGLPLVALLLAMIPALGQQITGAVGMLRAHDPALCVTAAALLAAHDAAEKTRLIWWA